jgi:hypothetical protein
MSLFRNFDVNHADGVTALELRGRRTGLRPRAMPLISLNLQKIAHFWIENLPVPLIKPWMGTDEQHYMPLKSDGTMLKHISIVIVTDVLMAPICGILL